MPAHGDVRDSATEKIPLVLFYVVSRFALLCYAMRLAQGCATPVALGLGGVMKRQ